MNAASKLGATIALLALLGAGAVGCSSSDQAGSNGGDSSNTTEQTKQEEQAPVTVSLEGTWKQNNSNSEDAWQEATITGDTIEVYWVADNGDTRSLYWAGTVEVPEGEESFSFDSANDHEKTDSSIMASPDDTKTFTYENDELSYDVTAMGTTMKVRLTLQ